MQKELFPYPRRTMEYPHKRGLSKGMDPVLMELIQNMRLAIRNEHTEQLMHMLCSGVWWLGPAEIGEIAGWMLDRLENR